MNTAPVPRHQCLVAGNAISGIGAAYVPPSPGRCPSVSRRQKDVTRMPISAPTEPASPPLSDPHPPLARLLPCQRRP